MIRVLFWLLLLANIGLFSAMQWGENLWGEPVTVQPELNQEKIRLMDAGQIALAEKASAYPAASAVSATNMQLALDIQTPVPDKPSESICLEWGDFLDVELKQVKTALSTLELGGKLTKRQVEQTIGFWVFIPPMKGKAAITKKIAQLKERGITEYFIVQEAGSWQNAISLGVFRTEEAARKFLTVLRENQVTSAKVGKRNSKHKLSVFILNGVDAAIEAKLAALQKDFADSEIKKVSCRLTR